MMTSTQTTEPCQAFLAWREAIDAAADLRAPLIGRRVTWIVHTDATGVIKDVTASGLQVRWDHSGVVEICHPDLVVFI